MHLKSYPECQVRGTAEAASLSFQTGPGPAEAHCDSQSHRLGTVCASDRRQHKVIIDVHCDRRLECAFLQDRQKGQRERVCGEEWGQSGLKSEGEVAQPEDTERKSTGQKIELVSEDRI